MNTMTERNVRRKLLISGIGILAISLLVHSPLFAATTTIVSDSSWKSTDSVSDPGTCPADAGATGPSWTDVDFDDTGWRYAIAPYPMAPGSPPPLPGSYWMWDFDGVPPTWGVGPNQAFFRRSFTIDSQVISAMAEFWIDDELQFYVNGNLVAEDLSGGAGYVGPIDFAPFLQQGENVLAIRAWDGGGCSVWNRLTESLSVVVSIETDDAAVTIPDDTMPPTGAVHAHDNSIWPPNNKMVEVTLDGYVLDELSIIRDGEGIGVSFAYLLVDGTMFILRDDSTDLLDENGNFNIAIEVKSVKGVIYDVELYATDTEPEDAGGPNSGLVDSTYIRVPHDMSRGKSGK